MKVADSNWSMDMENLFHIKVFVCFNVEAVIVAQW